jgi:hypothetical protein
MSKIIVMGTDIALLNIKDEDYISLTDMVRKIENGVSLIENG